jgi:thioredoxin 1
MYKSYSELGPRPEENRDQYSVLELKSSEERAKLISTCRVVCVDIYAEWCGPCKQTAPAYSMLAKKYEKTDMCALVKLNWDKISADERQKITGIPLFLFYVDGQLVDNVIGADLDEVEKKVKACLETISSGPNVSRGPQHTRNTIRSHRQPSAMPLVEGREMYPQQGAPNYQQGSQQGGPNYQQGSQQGGPPRQQNQGSQQGGPPRQQNQGSQGPFKQQNVQYYQ